MTMHEGMLRPGCLTVRDGRRVLEIHLPWYRSLPMSCLESIEVDGRPCDPENPSETWDLREPLRVIVPGPARSPAASWDGCRGSPIT